MERSPTPMRLAFAGLATFAGLYVGFGANGWGPPAAHEQAIGEISRWCERVSDGLMREPSNTLGNLGFVIAGLAMFWILRGEDNDATRPFIGNSALTVLYAGAVVFLGPGSMVMHGTHTQFGSWIDNVSMVTYILIPWLFNLSRMGGWNLRSFFASYSMLLAIYAAGYWFIGPELGINLDLFDISIAFWLISELLYRWWSPALRWVSGLAGFGIAAVFGIFPAEMLAAPAEYWWVVLFWVPALLATGPAPGKRIYTPWFWAGLVSFMTAYAIWLTGVPDHRWCDPDSPFQAHAIWHLLTALSTWCFFKFLRTETQSPTGSETSEKGRATVG